MSKIREIIDKYAEEISTDRGFESFCIYIKDFDKLEKELRDLIEWSHVGNGYIQIDNKFYKYAGKKMDFKKKGE